MIIAAHYCPLITMRYKVSGHCRPNKHSIYYGVIFPKVSGWAPLSTRVNSCPCIGGPDGYQ